MNIYRTEHPIKRFWRVLLAPLDRRLVLFISLIYLFSLLVLYSADQYSFDRLGDKLIYTILAFGLMCCIARISPQSIMQCAPYFYFIGLVMLVAVHVAGVTVNGARRWLDLYIFTLQPSEVMKPALPMMLAWYLYRIENGRRWYHYVIATLFIMIPSF